MLSHWQQPIFAKPVFFYFLWPYCSRPICGASRPPRLSAESRARLLHIRRTRSAARVRRREPRSGEMRAALAIMPHLPPCRLATCHFGRGRFHPVSSALTTSKCSGTETELAQLQCSGMERRQTDESVQAAGGTVLIQTERRAEV